ncbi:E4.2 [Odocoileus adenovirus 1]|uniref:E4.2 n=2 Tax=Deer atadenovirus A TaxID=2169706 RepID=A0A515MFS5_9ADEN|nr:E4.2 [Odocoileus adenovirus 1]QDM55333.1 E4.2 [Deer atadenovirus A]ASU50487.1 E4.2 [Odocoileus adenovirus 1]ASU50514.1 E4.2 [Odocoileus adenovirus 1]ASU50541.1 E4.2 [Odocoileus adenovirus 1]ASU50568.1 E4.2 [Odocoileus adenovirus 1]
MELNLQVIACKKPELMSHGLELFRCHGRGRLCPALQVTNLKKLLTPVIYDQFFCTFPISQKKDSFYRKREMDYIFYYHCHCNSPGSLQCLAAKNVLLLCFNDMPVTLYSERIMRMVPICCNTWVCCPIMFLGAFKMGHVHFYFFFCGISCKSFTDAWFNFHSSEEIQFGDSCRILGIKCRCNWPFNQCLQETEKKINCLRLLHSCTFLFRITHESPWHL